jgi:uncharacterized membrane protein
MQVIFDIQRKVDDASAGYRLSIENVLQVGFNLFRKSPGIFIIYSILGIVALSNPISGLILGGPVITGYYIVSQLISHDRHVELPDFFKSFDKFTPLLILNLLIALVVFIGLLLLIIPGIYFAVSYLFAHFFVWYYDVDPSEAIRLSRKTVSGNFGQILLLCLVLGGINLIGILAFGVGILLTLPFTYCVIYAAFDDIIGIP